MLDYAHNEGAYIELKKYLSTVKKARKIGVISVAGDRRIIDMQRIGFYAAEIFDEIIIKHDKNSRGNTNENITQALKEGILSSKCHPRVEVISDEFTAVKQALEKATPDSFIFYSPEKVFKAIEFIKNQQEAYKQNHLIPESTSL
ncbi:glutamate ligase domain-containing protein [Legionella sp. km772]|uniref:glutamate ligase domain-containing protein n=1 Tax=Legionella sp. km772 TaxID=2498111 RepID=UPI0013153C9D|nr:cyanophycin synthetase [Legionella sp. km772]